MEEAARLGLRALALTDHDGFSGIVRFAEAAAALDVPTIFGAELTLDLPRKTKPGAPDPGGRHLVILARDPQGYAQLARAITDAHMSAGEKSRPKIDLATLAGHRPPAARPAKRVAKARAGHIGERSGRLESNRVCNTAPYRYSIAHSIPISR